MLSCITRGSGLTVTSCFLPRSLHNGLVSRKVPSPSGSISTPTDFLKAIGRSSETKLSVGSWEELWTTSGSDMKAAGVSVRDRRYILWCMEKYRSGLVFSEFAHEPKAKKTIRGWGPKMQYGKLIRSRRHK